MITILNEHKIDSRVIFGYDEDETAIKICKVKDETGEESEMIRIPKIELRDLGFNIDGYHPAFIVDNNVVDYLYVSRFPNIIINGLAYSKSIDNYTCDITIDDARESCAKKGRGWHLMSNIEYAITKSSLSYMKTDTIMSVCGMMEYIAGVRLLNGQIEIVPDNNSAINIDECKFSNKWKAFDLDGNIVDRSDENTLKLDSTESDPNSYSILKKGSIVLSDKIENPLYSHSTDEYFDYAEEVFQNLKSKLENNKIPDILKIMQLFPKQTIDIDYAWTNNVLVRNYGERILTRGDSFGRYGLFDTDSYYFQLNRFANVPSIGFRSCYVEL